MLVTIYTGDDVSYYLVFIQVTMLVTISTGDDVSYYLYR